MKQYFSINCCSFGLKVLRSGGAKGDNEMKELRVRQLNKSLAKEYIKLDKAKALVV